MFKKKERVRIPGAEWIPDTKVCMNSRCKGPNKGEFGLTNRPHHCRWCGRVLCIKCAPDPPKNQDRRCRQCALPFCFLPVRFDYPKRPSPVNSSANAASQESPRVPPSSLQDRTDSTNMSQQAAPSVSEALLTGTNQCGTDEMPVAANFNAQLIARDRSTIRQPLHLVLGPFNATACDTILSFLDFKTTNALMQTCVKLQTHFPIAGIPYLPSIQTRFPTHSKFSRIGDGGGGVVYFAEDAFAPNPSNRYVAVKVVEKKKQLCYSVFKRLMQEIELQGSLDHPNIARLKQVFQTPDDVVLVVEAGGGGSLRRAFDKVRTEKSQVYPFTAHCVSQVAQALEYLRQKGITHRDIKSDNVVLSEDFSRVMVIDFGLSERIVSESQKYTPCGTQGFASPENISVVVERKAKMVANADTMHRSDVYSLGVVVFLMLSGTKPLRSSKFPDMFKEMQRGIRCQGSYWSQVPADAKDLVESMLKFKTSERSTALQILEHPFIKEQEPKFQALVEDRREELRRVEQSILDQWDTLEIARGDDDEWLVEGIPMQKAVRKTIDDC